MKITDALLGEHAAFFAQFDYLEQVIPVANSVAQVKSLVTRYGLHVLLGAGVVLLTVTLLMTRAERRRERTAASWRALTELLRTKAMVAGVASLRDDLDAVITNLDAAERTRIAASIRHDDERKEYHLATKDLEAAERRSQDTRRGQ